MGADAADIRSRAAVAPASGAAGPRLDRSRFATLFQGSARAFWAIAAAIVRDSEEAHDVVQEAAMTALGKIDEFDPATDFVAWAGQIVRYTALNELRRRKRERTRVETVAREIGDAVAEPRPADAAVATALDDLDEAARACVLMRVVTGMSYGEISKALGIPEGTAMSHVHRSRLRMRDAVVAKEEPAGPFGGER
jgi:RNA polymerase sigma-70 factor (ECF subfamily)